MEMMTQWEADTPVLAEKDVVIVGGSFAGIACAVELAKAGQRIMIIEPRTYLGRELSASLRPWLDLSTSWNRPELIQFVIDQAGEQTYAADKTYLPLHPDRLKRALEDKLIAHDITLLYASLPVAIVTNPHSNEREGLVIANKTGSQVILCKRLIDMTETNVVAQLTGHSVESYVCGKTAAFARTLEFTGVSWPEEDDQADELIVPNSLGLLDNKVNLVHGYRDGQHVYVEYWMVMASGNQLEIAGERELEARRRGMDLTAFLVQNVPAFRKANLCSSSFELHGPVPLHGGAEVEQSQYLDPTQATVAGMGLAAKFLDEPVVEQQAVRPYASKRVVTNVPTLSKVEVLVIGGGSSGACASITAGGEGVSTMLVDMNPGLGGTGTFGGVDSYWFGRREGFAARIHNAVLTAQQGIGYKGHKWNIEAKMFALQQEAKHHHVDLLFNAFTYAALMENNTVCGVLVATRWGPVAIYADVVIDATGDGDVAAFAGAEFVYGSAKDHTVMWYSLAQFSKPDKIQNNFTSMVDVSDIVDYTRAIMAGRRRGDPQLHDHGIYVATRESRHIIGETVMQLSDQLLQRSWPDVINVHFSNHDVKGVSGADWINIGLIPPNLEIEIPYRLLLPKGIEGVLVAGKAISATHDALPAIRMQSDLENLGGVAALAAALAVRTGVPPRRIGIKELQDRLIREGILSEAVRTRQLAPIQYTNEELKLLVDNIESDQPLYEYANMRMNEIYKECIPFVEICSLGQRIVPYLIEAMEHATGMRELRLAQALATLGSKAAVPVLIARIMEELQGTELPRRTADMMYVQLPPDHGAMPDVVYLLYSLAQTQDSRAIAVWERVVELMQPSEEDFKDTWLGLYYYVDAVSQGAERLGDRDAIPLLERLHQIPYLHAQMSSSVPQSDYFLERRAMLELVIGRALARCGSRLGYDVLIQYVCDGRSLLAKQALQQLKAISGEFLTKDPVSLRSWLDNEQPYRHTYPLQTQLDIETNSESILRG
ncbi:FAD-dependent oxidoreductase [Paenibacillus qinlingensis]|uniref:Ribulose 1,5-bisphosphate synthetase/thiazole synthase n=1 Tax=Paenibacillus qinlingensis TaxID=1837343 RepID=A0ABU1P067_9BACL|nr:FAD-dependent oxidoreductase [Paenibacillus qinlingensis]MDR6553140.1 ribulose 1,5-bisphosphate synthetase/thiazole synthase [Paenibacillus qinlingensis]